MTSSHGNPGVFQVVESNGSVRDKCFDLAWMAGRISEKGDAAEGKDLARHEGHAGAGLVPILIPTESM